MPSLPWIENALVQPCSGSQGRQKGWYIDGGVYDAAGDLLKSGFHAGDRLIQAAPAQLTRDDLPPLPGRWLFGGWLQAHFGHYLVFCMGRLWPLPDLTGQIDGVVFLCLRDRPKRIDIIEREKPIRDILACLGIGTAIKAHVVHEPTRFAQLAMPQHLIIGPKGARPENDAAFMRIMRAMRHAPPVSDGIRTSGLYVSRRRLKPSQGGILFEDMLEENLAAEGYTIIYPERLSVAEQLALYSGSRRMIFAEGSSLHLAVGCMDEDDAVAVIARRRPLTEAVRRYLNASGVRQPTVVRAVRGAITFLQKGQVSGLSTYHAHAVLDLAEVRDQLVAAGLCRGVDWRIPTEAEYAAGIEEVVERRRRLWADKEVRFLDAAEYQGNAAPAPAPPGGAVSGPG